MLNTQLLELIISSLPYPDQIKDFAFHETCIQFTWRGTKFNVSQSMIVKEVEDGVLSGSNIAIILECLLKKTDLLRTI